MTKNFPPTVLVVDDDALMRWSLAESLGDCGYAVTEADDGGAALTAIERAARPFDIVLLDYHLPDSTDLRLLMRVKHLSPASQVILISAYTSEFLPSGCAGAYQVVAKPFELEHLAALVTEARTMNSSRLVARR